jgi:alcohol dehydrogenase class IV
MDFDTSFAWRSPVRLVFGCGETRNLANHLAPFGLHSVLLCCGSSQTRQSEGFALVQESLKAAGIGYTVFSDITADPSADQVRQATALLTEGSFEGVVAYGGGSPIDCAKSAALCAANQLDILDIIYNRQIPDKPALPIIAIPTTAGTGSELSSAAVTTDSAAARKIGFSHESLFPQLALVDPLNQLSMPPGLTAATGMDALTHVLESLLSTAASPLSDALNLYCLGLIGRNLEQAWANPNDIAARSAMALASALAGAAFSQTGLGMVHGFAHPVGARQGLAHGTANAIMLPYLLAAMAGQSGVSEKLARAAIAFGCGSDKKPANGASPNDAAELLVAKIADLKQRFGIATGLRDSGLSDSALPAILADACSYRNRQKSPRAFTDPELARLLDVAWNGDLAGAWKI